MSDINIQVIDFQSAEAPVKFTRSLKETGFAAIQNHSIDMDLVNDVYQEWENFFQSDYKHNYKFHPEQQDGYFPFGIEHAKDYSQKDLKEFYHIYPWGRYPQEISSKTRELYQYLCDLAGTLLIWVEENTPKEVKSKFSIPLKEMVIKSPRNLLRIIHYPPMRDTDDPDEVRAAAHEDINLLTVLCSATAPGLQAQDLEDNWHEVPCDPGMLAVNTGDMLQMASGGYFPSTTHRVINPPNEARRSSRMSMPLFLHPHDNVKLSDTHTAGSYLTERLEEIGLV